MRKIIYLYLTCGTSSILGFKSRTPPPLLSISLCLSLLRLAFAFPPGAVAVSLSPRPGWLHSPLFAQVTPALSVVAAPRPKSRTAHGLLAGCRQVRSHKLAAPMGSVGLLVYLWGEIWNSCSKHNYFTDCHVAVRVPRCCLDSQTQYIRHSR